MFCVKGMDEKAMVRNSVLVMRIGQKMRENVVVVSRISYICKKNDIMRRFLLLVTVMLSAMSVSVAMADDQATKQVEEVVEEELWVEEAGPQFPGGDLALREWIKQNMVYPQEAIAKGIEGRVIVKFTVEEDGTITNGKILRGIDPLLDKEALRLVSIMPKWSPGRFAGKDTRFTYNLPLLFKLPKSQD